MKAIVDTDYRDTSAQGACVVFQEWTDPSSATSWAPASGLSATNVANPLALVPGTYTVVVTDANGCTAVATAVVTGSAPPALSTTASPSNCNQSEGSINLTVQGGTPGYTFSWSNGGSQEDLQNLPPGTYTVTVTDAAGCSATASATVNVIGLTAGFTTVVLGDVVSFTNSSVNATSFSWTFGDGDGSTQTNPTHTYAADGTYTVTLTALNACGSSTFSQMVTIVTPPVAGFSVSDSTGCVPFSVQYTSAASANTVTYKWLFPGGSPASSTVANPAVSYAVPGVYSATLIAGNAAGAFARGRPGLPRAPLRRFGGGSPGPDSPDYPARCDRRGDCL